MVEWRTAAQTYGFEDRQMVVTGTSRTLEIEGLENGMEYMFSVRAGNDAGYGPYSTETEGYTDGSAVYRSADQLPGRFRQHDDHGFLGRAEGGCGLD